MHALLFLFYEPNFDDPLNADATRPENGLTMEQTIRKSLRGGLINGVRYAPNRAWLRWVEENGIETDNRLLADEHCQVSLFGFYLGLS